MFTYIQVTDGKTQNFKGLVDYKFDKEKLSMTLVRGMKHLQHIIIPLSKITDLMISKFYGYNRINFVYDSKRFSIINTGYGESQYFENKICHSINK